MTYLFAQLFFAKFVESVEFLRQRDVVSKTTRCHLHANDRQTVGNHHGHGAKVQLEILRQLLSTGIARIHGEKDAELGVHLNDVAVREGKLTLSFLLAGENDGDLLCRNGENRQIDTIELIEATERARLSKTLEDATQATEIHLIGTVEYLEGTAAGVFTGSPEMNSPQRISQGTVPYPSLSPFFLEYPRSDESHPRSLSLSLTCSSGSSRCSTHVHMQCLCQGNVASIGQRRDHQPLVAAEKFVHVREIDIGDRDLHLVQLLVEVESRLLEPVEVRHRANVAVHELVEDVLLMHVNSDQRLVLRPFDARQISRCLIDQYIEQVGEDVCCLPHDVSVEFRLT